MNIAKDLQTFLERTTQKLDKIQSAIKDLQTQEPTSSKDKLFEGLDNYNRLFGLVSLWEDGIVKGTGNSHTWPDAANGNGNLAYNGSTNDILIVDGTGNEGPPVRQLDGGGYLNSPDNSRWDLGGSSLVPNILEGFTVGAWVKFDNSPTATEYIFSKSNPTSNDVTFTVFRASNGRLWGELSENGSLAHQIQGPMIDQSWHFIAFSGSARTQTLRLFVDGEEYTAIASFTDYFNSNAPFRIGALGDASASNKMTGKIYRPFFTCAYQPINGLKNIHNSTKKILGL